MPTLAWMKKLASILLLVCFVLPLSKCESKQEMASYLYGYQMALDERGELDASSANMSTLVLLVIVFFLPAISLLLAERWQAPVLLGASFPALYALFGWVIALATAPQLGGILAIECWLFLMATSASTLWFRWFGKRRPRAAEPS